MPNVVAQENFLKMGSILDSYIHLKKGQMAIQVPIVFQSKQYFINCGFLEPGAIQGLEFIFEPKHPAAYNLFALKNSDIELIKTNSMELYGKTSSEIMNLFLQYKPTLESILKSQTVIDQVFANTHKVFYSFIAVLGYIFKTYQFEVSSPELLAYMNNMNTYIKDHRLDSSIFPLTDKLYKISFEAFNPYAASSDFIHTFYLKRILQLLEYIQSGLGKDKVFSLNLLMESSLKTEKLIQSTQSKMQETLRLLEIFFNPATIKVLKGFFEHASRSEEVLKYIFLSIKNTVGFFEHKTIAPIEHIDYELFLSLKQSLEPYKDMLAHIGSNVQPQNNQSNQNNSILGILKGSLNQILDYAQLEEEFKSKFLEDYNKWKISPHRMAVDDDINKMRKRLTEHFWKIYIAAFKQHKLNNKPLIKPVELFFKYGFLDETLMSELLLKALLDRSKEVFKDSEPRVYNVYDWILAVCDERVAPSNSKTGEYLDITLRELARDEEQKINQKLDPKAFNTLEFRIDYEINNFIRESSKFCNGMFANYIPILLEEQFPNLDLNHQFLSADKITRTFTELKKIDFSIFYREVRYKSGNIEEFVQKEILPIFILMPGVGSRSIVWQPKERPKDTSARIALPFLSFTNPIQAMLYSFGFYRWEIVKDILGPSWNDISLLSITSEYSDYESSYKNSKEIDNEIKEKIAQDFKKYRNTRDRFIHDYSRWITIDSQGRPGVNKIVREIFYRQIPFPKDIRAKLGNMPSYQNFNDRYTILMKKELARLKLRFQKYQKEDGVLPTDLAAYLQFLIK